MNLNPRQLVAASLLVIVCLLNVGCLSWKLPDVVPGATDPQDQVWSIEPVEMRVYPSTRFVIVEGTPVLEARVEFVDALGDSIKATGNFRVELFRVDRSGSNPTGRRLYKWEVPMVSIRQNRTFYDPITRAYLLRLKMDDLEGTGEPSIIVVTFTQTNGERLTAKFTIRPGD